MGHEKKLKPEDLELQMRKPRINTAIQKKGGRRQGPSMSSGEIKQKNANPIGIFREGLLVSSWWVRLSNRDLRKLTRKKVEDGDKKLKKGPNSIRKKNLL